MGKYWNTWNPNGPEQRLPSVNVLSSPLTLTPEGNILNLETNKRHWLWLNYVQVLALLLNMWPLVHFLSIQVFIFLTCKLIVIIVAVNVMANFCQWDNKSVSKLCMHAKLLQSCPTLCDSMGYSSPGSSVHEILQARIWEWVAIPLCRGSSQPRDQSHISYVSCIDSQGLRKRDKI